MSLRKLVFPALLAWFAAALHAASDRIAAPVDPSRTMRLPGRVHSLAQARFDRGLVDPSMTLDRITVLLRPDPSLNAFLDGLHTPGSPDYRAFLTPEQFGERFGASSGDLAKIRAWLESQGLKVTETARGRHWIAASGTASAASRAFHTEFHRYLVNGQPHFANSIQPSVPAALGGIVAGIYGLHDFHPQPMVQPAIPEAAAQATIGGTHYITPDDFATIFDIQALYSAGIDGAGQNIAVAGQTAINATDIANFRSQFHLPASTPQLVLVGKSPGNLGGTQLAEADLDIEWSGAVAPNATIVFVYSSDAFTSAQYAVDQNLAPVVTISFGACEQDYPLALQYVAQQANAQGITVLAASGDYGAAVCDALYDTSTQQSSLGPSATFPAGVPEVTALGGTTLTEGSGVYWSATNNANGGSALSYIPESAWNDTVVRNAFSTSGGAASVVFPQPAWQTGPGVPLGGGRTTPDVSLPASPQHDGYEVVSNGVTSIFGGTSVSSPAFAGIVALLNQYLTSKGMLAKPGLGNINPDLYRLAQSTTGVFHDTQGGNNKVACVQASPGCTDLLVGYDAAPGYDLATGWGSVDVNNLVTQWSTGAATATALSATPSSPALGDAVQLAAAVSGNGSATPTGTVTFLVADTVIGSATLANGAAALSTTGLQLAANGGQVSAAYSGDPVYDASGATITVALKPPAKGSMVAPSISPNPVYAAVTSAGSTWQVAITLTNLDSVATTFTGFQFATLDESSQIAKFFGATKIPGNSSLSANLQLTGLVPPMSVPFTFSGADADGTTWKQTVNLAIADSQAPPLLPQINLTSTPGTVVQNPGSTACPWSQLLTVQNLSGFTVELNALTAGSANLNNSISQIFGATRVAPYGALQGAYCPSNITPPANALFTISGSSQGGSASASVTAGFAAAAANPASLAVTPAAVTIPVTSSSPGAAASLTLNFNGGSPAWSLSVLPVNGGTSWLTVNPLSGTGPAQVSLSVDGSALSSGVYQALLVVQSAGALPQYITVPVALVVGASATTTIAGAANNGSNAATFAPGEQIAVYGSQLAPAGITGKSVQFPLLLNINGVTAAVNGVAAPFYYVSAGQIDLQIPYETAAGTAILSVNNNGQVAAFPLTIASAAPGMYGIWTTSGTPVTTAAQGATLVTYTTGEGDVVPSLATGATPPSNTPLGSLPHPRQTLAVTVGGMPASVLFAGIPSGLAGVTQINFTVPANAPVGNQQVVVTVGGVASPPVNLTVTAAGQ